MGGGAGRGVATFLGNWIVHRDALSEVVRRELF
jgi:hypothetical protein